MFKRILTWLLGAPPVRDVIPSPPPPRTVSQPLESLAIQPPLPAVSDPPERKPDPPPFPTKPSKLAPEPPDNRSDIHKGKLTHQRVYTFGVTRSGQSSTRCPICHELGQYVFSIATDEAGEEHRCCIWCLRRLGGRSEVERASRRSKHIRRVAKCMDALDALRSEFPDPSRRPFGEKALIALIACPFGAEYEIDRIITKILSRKWTAQDSETLESRPLPPADN